MTLNQRGKWATTVDPAVGLRKTDGIIGIGLYGGVVRDLKDPSKKAISGKILNSIKPFFCGSYCVRFLRRSLAAILIVCRPSACV